jgi:hypothetical protein
MKSIFKRVCIVRLHPIVAVRCSSIIYLNIVNKRDGEREGKPTGISEMRTRKERK